MVTEEELNPAQRAQRARDLLGQVEELQAYGDGGDPEIIFRETSRPRQKYPIYSMTDGEELLIPRNLVTSTLNKRDSKTSRLMFTAFKEEAPEYKLGQVKCFLHPDSADRAILEDIGLTGTVCEKSTLTNSHSKRIHAQHRHKQEWAAYQEYLEDQKEDRNNERQERQLEATLAIAKSAGKGADK